MDDDEQVIDTGDENPYGFERAPGDGLMDTSHMSSDGDNDSGAPSASSDPNAPSAPSAPSNDEVLLEDVEGETIADMPDVVMRAIDLCARSKPTKLLQPYVIRATANHTIAQWRNSYSHMDLKVFFSINI